MRQLSPQQLQYVLDHLNDRPREAVAKAAGISISSLYRLVRKHGGEIRHELNTRDERFARLVLERYPFMTTSELVATYGGSPTTVRKLVREYGLKHNAETMRRISEKRKKWHARSQTEEAKRKRVVSWKRKRKVDELRLLSGMPTKTRHHFKSMPVQCRQTIWRLVRRNDYFQVEEEPFTLYYDALTHRTRGEPHLAKKYGLRFLPADDYDL